MAKSPMPFGNPYTYAGHGGIDYAQAQGTPVRAVADGKITYSAWWNNNAGNTRTLTLDNGLQMMHCHLVNLNGPAIGTRVRAGDIIAYVGTTGRSTGPHLHHELWLNGVKQDGAKYWNWIDRNRVIGASGSGAGSGGGPVSQATKDRQNWLNVSRGENLVVDGQQGTATTEAYKRYQTFLRAYGYTGAIDGDWGAGTQSAHENYYNQIQSGGLLSVDGKMGPATVKKLQERLGVTADGDWGPATTKALQTWLGVSADGQLGRDTISALQRAVGASVDGEMGPNTIKALQASLNTGGFAPKPPVVTPPVDAPLTVDGEMGPATVKKLQKVLGVEQDGELGPITIKALQKAVGQAEDGQMGPKTIKAVQTNVGATVDGHWGPETIKALQTFLNENKNFRPVIIEDTPITTYPKPEAATYPGAGWWNHSPNSSPRRDSDKVQYFVVHHAADTNSVPVQRDRFMKSNDRNVSPNWLIGADGSVSEIVPPDKYRAWTTGAFDYNAVTVETQNTSGAPGWGISQESHEAIAKVVAWASKRYGFPIDRQHVLGHREVPGVPATACPGPSMDLDKIVNLAKGYANPTDPEVPTEPTDPDVWTITIPKDEAIALKGLLTEFIRLLP